MKSFFFKKKPQKFRLPEGNIWTLGGRPNVPYGSVQLLGGHLNIPWGAS